MAPLPSSPSDRSRLAGACGAEVLGLAPGTLVDSVRAGLPTETFERLRELLGLPARELGAALSISKRTLARRREKGRLTLEESDRLLRLARLAEMALAVFEGNREGAQGWLTESKMLLGGESPVKRADTQAGAREVEDMLYALEFGFPA